jgi:transcriptional regulator with XRE-family HTH domain
MRRRLKRVASIVNQAERRGIGEKLRALRKYRRLTLVELGKRTGYSVSALSKMENERLSLTYDKLARLAIALDVDMSTLFTDSPPVEGPQPVGRRSIARKGRGKSISTGNYDYLYISPELSRKQMVPVVVKIRATSIEEFGPLIRHGGEEWIYVTKGEIEVHSEFYQPERLREGDSIYLDSRMGHAYISKSKGGAEVVSVCSAPEAELFENADAQPKPRSPQSPRVKRAEAR